MTAASIRPGFLSLPRSKIRDWVPRLKELYEFESGRISGAGSAHLDIRDVLWTRKQLHSALSLNAEDTARLNELIDFMVQQHQMLQVPPFEDEPERLVSRVAETIRSLGHTYEYWVKGRPGINAIRWLIEEKSVPQRLVPPAELASNLVKEVASHPDVSKRAPNLTTAISTVVTRISKEFGGERHTLFSDFQCRAIKSFLLSYYSPDDGRPGASIITAGVGSGKTIGFSLGALIVALEGELAGGAEHRTFLLVYPRKALAINQAAVIGRYVDDVGAPNLTFQLEHESSYSPPVWKGVAEVYGGNRPPNIVVTTFETLKRRIQNPLFARALSRHLAGIVVDEIHLAEGLGGGHIALLMRRVRAIARNRKLVMVGSSGTVARPDEHAGRIFGLPHKTIEVITPRDDALDVVGLAHHVFLRPSGWGSPQGALVNATSLLIHSRRDDVGARPGSEKKRQKSIAFADNLDMLGRWNSDLRENERTEGEGERQHPSSPSRSAWDERQRELPYAQRFQRPLVRRLNASGGAGESFEPILPEEKAKIDWCTRCQAGEKLVIAENLTAAQMAHFGELVHRHPFVPTDPLKIFRLKNPIFRTKSSRIGTLDLCPYLRAAACLWFPQGVEGPELPDGSAQPPPFSIEPVPAVHPRIYEWRNVVRSAIYSSKSSQTAENTGDDLADIVYKAPASLVYGIDAEEQVQLDVVLASPSLEVGVDIEALTESVMTRAMRSVASYRQKAGRVGREEGLDVLNVTLVHDTPVDLHYYRQPRKLVSRGRLDPIPLKDRNDAILYSGLYNAVWDWLALTQLLPEPVPIAILPSGRSEFSEGLARCRDALLRQPWRDEAREHLKSVARSVRDVKQAEIDAALDQVVDEIGLLLRKTDGTFIIRPTTEDATLADLMIYLDVGMNRPTRDVRPALGGNLEPFFDSVNDFTKLLRRLPVDLGLSVPPFGELLKANRTGDWRPESIRAVTTGLRDYFSAVPNQPAPPAVRELTDSVLPRLESSLQEIVDSGHDPMVYAAWEAYVRILKSSESWHRRYLFDLLRNIPALEAFRKERWFVRTENLFTNPLEPRVSLQGPYGRERESVPIGEALASYLPGVWTFRYPEACYKIKTGPLELGLGGRLIARLPDILLQGTQVERVATKLPPPPGILSPVDVYRPIQLSLKEEKRKYPLLDRVRGLVLDKDEASGGTGGVQPENIKVPKSYLNRWVHASPGGTEPILVSVPDEGSLIVDLPEGEVAGAEARKSIRHPLFETHLSSAAWHSPLNVTEYVCSVSRSYTGGGGEGITLTYQDRYGVDVGFGDTYATEGFSLNLNQDRVSEVVESATREMDGGNPAWQPSLLKAFKVLLANYVDSGGLPIVGSQFLLDDIIAIVLWDGVINGPLLRLERLLGTVAGLESDPNLEDRVKALYRGKLDPEYQEPEDFNGAIPELDDKAVIQRARTLVDVIRALSLAVRSDSNALERARQSLKGWARRTLLNTLGVVAVTALQEYSGATDKDVGYAIDSAAWSDGGIPRIYLYDRARFGNGSAEAAHRYFHVPHLLRHGLNLTSRLLPTEDFLSRLEEGLLQCPQFHADMSALEINSKSKGGGGSGILGLSDVEDSAKEVQHISGTVWDSIGVSGPTDGWRLPIAAASVDAIVRSAHLPRDDIIRATQVCWTGCPECVDRIESAVGGPMAHNYVDKFLLDSWFMGGIARSQEYAVLGLGQLGSGESMPNFGGLHDVVLDLPKRRIRSACLPWTIGLFVRRDESPALARVIMRVSDILGYRLSTPPTPGVATGIESVGFKRLLWFDLVVTAYLDSLGFLKPEQRVVELVYYDCRDLDFTDVGLSPRMLESIVAVARAKGSAISGFDSLSDILGWLASQGFRIRICVDAVQAQEAGVVSFLRRVTRLGAGNLSVFTKDVERGHMHKKVLITPVAVLTGTANLSVSGSSTSEESISHYFLSTGAYSGELRNARDTFDKGIQPWSDRRKGDS